MTDCKTVESSKISQVYSNARLAVVQALYQYEISEENPDNIILDYVSGRVGRQVIDEDIFTGKEEFVQVGNFDSKLFKGLLKYVLDNKIDIDAIITSHLSPKWPEERLEIVLRSILRTGIAELYKNTDIDIAVIISEYIDIARSFYEEGAEVSLVNAILDSVAKKVRNIK